MSRECGKSGNGDTTVSLAFDCKAAVSEPRPTQKPKQTEDRILAVLVPEPVLELIAVLASRFVFLALVLAPPNVAWDGSFVLPLFRSVVNRAAINVATKKASNKPDFTNKSFLCMNKHKKTMKALNTKNTDAVCGGWSNCF